MFRTSAVNSKDLTLYAIYIFLSIQACKINNKKYKFVYSTTNNGLIHRPVMQVFCTADNKIEMLYSTTEYTCTDCNKSFLTFETS